jgi:ferrous iron transport protein B
MPVYILIAGAFFPHHAGLVLLGLYALGIVLAIIAARIMSYFIKDDDLPFVMELPPYRIPTGKSIFRHTWEKGRQYLQKMSGVILVCSLIIWALGYFPRGEYETVQQQQENSYIGTIGKGIEPVLEPLGFDWRMGVGIISGVGAKELVVSTLGVMYSGYEPEASAADPVGDVGVSDVAISSAGHVSLSDALKHAVTPAGALAYMVFILLYFPCVATFIAIRNETGSWKWALLTAVYTIVLAWVASFATFHISGLFL